MTLRIEYQQGHMDIYFDKFFPASKGQIRKLSKVVLLDNRYRFDREFWGSVTQWMEDEIRRACDEEQALRRYISKAYDVWSENKHLADDKKTPAGIPLNAQEIKHARSLAKENRKEINSMLSDVKKKQYKVKRLRGNIDFIKKEVLEDDQG